MDVTTEDDKKVSLQVRIESWKGEDFVLDIVLSL